MKCPIWRELLKRMGTQKFCCNSPAPISLNSKFLLRAVAFYKKKKIINWGLDRSFKNGTKDIYLLCVILDATKYWTLSSTSRDLSKQHFLQNLVFPIPCMEYSKDLRLWTLKLSWWVKGAVSRCWEPSIIWLKVSLSWNLHNANNFKRSLNI